jgi:predicted  nucleic acid-binding Zn-ribbon protein
MSGAGWEVWAAGATVLGVVLVLIGHMFKFASNEGARTEREKQLSDRVSKIEQRQSDAEREAKDIRDGAARTTSEIVGLKATLAALDQAVHDGFQRVEKALESLAPRTARRGGD